MKRCDALAAGLLTYDNGKPCRHGHAPAMRYAITGKCLACCKGETPRYRTKRAAYAARNSAAIVAKVATWKAKNPGKVRTSAARYRAKHRTRILAYNVTYRLLHPTDPLLRRIREARRRARAKAAGGTYTRADVRNLLWLQRARCAYCRKSLRGGFQVDHVMPLALGGRNDRRNLQLLCNPCNWSKQARHPADFARHIGLLV